MKGFFGVLGCGDKRSVKKTAAREQGMYSVVRLTGGGSATMTVKPDGEVFVQLDHRPTVAVGSISP